MRRAHERGQSQTSPLSAPIFAAIEEMIEPGAATDMQRLALRLRPIAFSTAYQDKSGSNRKFALTGRANGGETAVDYCACTGGRDY